MGTSKYNHLEEDLYVLAGKVLKKIRAGNVGLEIALIAGRDLSRLKSRFGLKKRGQIPDVLAFPEPYGFPHPERRGRRLLGEVYLNRDLPPERLGFLLIHGILHLCGLSHERKRDILKMEKMERRLMGALLEK